MFAFLAHFFNFRELTEKHWEFLTPKVPYFLMSDNRYVTFKVTFESMTPAEVEAERKAADEAFLNSDIEPDECEENRMIRYLEMPLSATVPFEKELNGLMDRYYHCESRI